MKITIFVIALLAFSAFSFRIKQGGGFTASAADATEGVQALGQAATDAATTIGDTFAASTQFLNQAVAQLTSGLAAMAGQAGAARLQQNAGFGASIADGQRSIGSIVAGINAAIQSATDIIDGATQLADQGIETLASAGGMGGATARLQQNPLGQVMADLARIGSDFTTATEDFINSADEALDGASTMTQQTLSGLAGAGGAVGARR